VLSSLARRGIYWLKKLTRGSAHRRFGLLDYFLGLSSWHVYPAQKKIKLRLQQGFGVHVVLTLSIQLH
jgi:hypothetical protein